MLASGRGGWRGELPRRYETQRESFQSSAEGALRAGDSVLEVGAGAAPAVEPGRRPRGVRYVGLDISAGELGVAAAGSYDETVVSSATNFVARLEHRFDVALSRFALEHVAGVDVALTNIRRYLCPGGRFVALLSGRYGLAGVINRALPSPLTQPLLTRLYGRAPESVFPARYESCTYSGLAQLMDDGWSSWTVTPMYLGGRYALASRALAALYLPYEEWALRRERADLAPYYVIEARA